LIPVPKVPTFAEYSAGWWDLETCHYMKWRQLHNPIVKSTLKIHQNNFKHHIKDFFAKFKLDEITPEIIKGWLVHMSEKTSLRETESKGEEKGEGVGEGKEKKKLKAKTVNLVFGTLRIMLNEAVKRKLIKTNPCNDVKELKEEETKMEILTVEEAKKLLQPDWAAVWDNRTVFLANFLAACTGLRMGEVRGLRCEYVFDDFIHVGGQFTNYGYTEMTKNKHSRNVPITANVRQQLEELLQANKGGYVFSLDGGKTPLKVDRIRRQFDNALEKIGISREEKMRRNLSFHAWRHFLNTLLRTYNVADSKVQSVTGHLTKKMTEHYNHFDTRKFTEVRDAQCDFLNEKKA
jgi:integrase